MVGKNSVAKNNIGEVNVDDRFATGQLISNGMPTQMYYHFYKESAGLADGEESWKMDLTSIFPAATIAFQQMADESGKEENDFLFMLLELVSGEKPNDNIWKIID